MLSFLAEPEVFWQSQKVERVSLGLRGARDLSMVGRVGTDPRSAAVARSVMTGRAGGVRGLIARTVGPTGRADRGVFKRRFGPHIL